MKFRILHPYAGHEHLMDTPKITANTDIKNPFIQRGEIGIWNILRYPALKYSLFACIKFCWFIMYCVQVKKKAQVFHKAPYSSQPTKPNFTLPSLGFTSQQ